MSTEEIEAAAPPVKQQPRPPLTKSAFTPEELATALDCSTRAIFRMEKDGDLPKGIRFTKRLIRFPIADVLAWAESCGLPLQFDATA